MTVGARRLPHELVPLVVLPCTVLKTLDVLA
jgi:hypothetical protein